MFLLGLTGDIACGKSTVARLLVERGAAHIDADLLVRELYADQAFARRVVAHLESATHRVLDSGKRTELLNSEAGLNRKALGAWVFNDTLALRALESLVHPAVAALRDKKLEELRSCLQPPAVVVLEAVKLVESGQAQSCRALWWVTANREIQLQRLVNDRGLTEAESQIRLSNQPSPTARQSLVNALQEHGVAFCLIENNGTLPQLKETIEEQWQRLLVSQKPSK